MVGDTFTEVIASCINILTCGIKVQTHHNAILQMPSKKSLRHMV